MPEPLGGLSEAWIWLGGSFILAVLAANVAWVFRAPRSGLIGSTVARLVAWPPSTGLHNVLRLLYYVGLPFAALLFGRDAVTASFLGLQPFEIPAGGRASASEVISQNWLDWARDTGWAVAAGAALFLFTLIARAAYLRALAAADFRETHDTGPGSGWTHLREAAFLEVHWAFYRNAPLIALRSNGESPYWGIWVGLGLVAVEAVLDPGWRQALSIPEQASKNLGLVSLAVLSAVLFWQTQNLWLAIALHFAISWALAAIARTTRPSEE